MTRVFDRELECGCLISSDGGGAVSPCCYVGYGATKEEAERCSKVWAEWMKTEDYQQHLKEVKERNQ